VTVINAFLAQIVECAPKDWSVHWSTVWFLVEGLRRQNFNILCQQVNERVSPGKLGFTLINEYLD